MMKDKRNAWERDYYRSNERSSSPAAVSEKNKPKESNVDSAPKRDEHSPKRTTDRLRNEKDDSSEAQRSKKHKKSKKKKKSKDKDKHHESV